MAETHQPAYGSTDRLLVLPHVVLSETHYDPGYKVPLHTHEDHFYFNLVLNGGYHETRQGKTICLRPWTLVYQPIGASHSKSFAEDRRTRLFTVRVDSRWLQAADFCEKLPSLSRIFNRGAASALALRMYDEFLHLNAASKMVVLGVLFEMLGETLHCDALEKDRSPAWLTTAVEFMHASLSGPLTVREIAACSGVHPIHFSRVFRRHFHCSVGDYVHRMRIRQAVQRLSSSHSLAQIAADCGFCDQGHFCRVFKRVMGVTPGAYKRAC